MYFNPLNPNPGSELANFPNGNRLRDNIWALSDALEKLQGSGMAPRKARRKASNGAPTRPWQFLRTCYFFLISWIK